MGAIEIIALALQAVPSLAAVLMPRVASDPAVPPEIRKAAADHMAALDAEILRAERLAGGEA